MLLAEVDDHRALINGITTLAQNDVTSYASSIVNEAPERVAAQLRVAGGAVVTQYGQIAATSGALFYETQRPRTGFTADLVLPIADDVMGSLGWAFDPLFNPDKFDNGPAEMIPRLAGMVQKYVSSADRDTVRAAGKRDALSTGVLTYPRAGGCAFCCLMSAQSARGGHWHNNCHCAPVPTWRDSPAPQSDVRDQQNAAANDAIRHLESLRYANPDYGQMRSRQFFAAHPELALTNKNITRVMRELYGFAH